MVLRFFGPAFLISAARKEIAGTAYSVGYGSASQFGREYARMFGAPPSRHAGREVEMVRFDLTDFEWSVIQPLR